MGQDATAFRPPYRWASPNRRKFGCIRPAGLICRLARLRPNKSAMQRSGWPTCGKRVSLSSRPQPDNLTGRYDNNGTPHLQECGEFVYLVGARRATTFFAATSTTSLMVGANGLVNFLGFGFSRKSLFSRCTAPFSRDPKGSTGDSHPFGARLLKGIKRTRCTPSVSLIAQKGKDAAGRSSAISIMKKFVDPLQKEYHTENGKLRSGHGGAKP
jgi:hypothetical protein